MDDIIIFIKDNYKWFFSGLGVFCIGLLIKSKTSTSQVMSNSKGIISGKNTTLEITPNKNDHNQ